MNTAKSRLTILSNKTVKGAVKRICESLIEMADSIPDYNLSQIAIDKLNAYTSDVAVKSFVSNESRLITLVDMGIKKSTERILTESSVVKYPHLKGPISKFNKLSEANPDYIIIENYLNVLKPLLWEPVVKNEYEMLEAKKNNLSEDILVKSSVDVIKTSRNAFIYGPLIEKLEAYVMDRTTGSRKMIIQELDRYKFDTNINKLANNLRLIENSFGGFNMLANTTKCTVKPSVGFVDIKESVDYFLLDGMFYKKDGGNILPVKESEILSNAPSLHAINEVSKRKGMAIQGETVMMFMGRDTVKIHESGTIDLNGTTLTRDELKHKAAVTSIIDPGYSRGLNDVLTIHENIDKLMEVDFSKTITSNIYEGVKINVIKGDEYIVNYVNPSMNENRTLKIDSATQLKNFVWDTLSYDISESFTETLSEENKIVNKLRDTSNSLFNRIVLVEGEIKKIEREKAIDEDVRENAVIAQLEESLHQELRDLKKKYSVISKKLNEASSGVPLPMVGDTVNVRAKGSGTVLSVDGVDKKFIVLLSNGETIQCIDKDIDVIEGMIKRSKTSSPEADLHMIQGSDAKPSGKHIKSGKMVKESEDIDIEGMSIGDVKGISNDPSNVVKHSEFGRTYDQDMESFHEMSAKGVEDYNPSIDEDYDEVEEGYGYDFEDWDEMDQDSDDYGFYGNDDDEEDFDYGDDDIDDDMLLPDDGMSGIEVDDEFEIDSPEIGARTYSTMVQPDVTEIDIDVDEDAYEAEDDMDEDMDDMDEVDEDMDDIETDMEYDVDEDMDDMDEVDEDIESAELEMEEESEDDLHHYEREAKLHPGYGSRQTYIEAPMDDEYELDGYPEEEDEMQIQFEENEEDDELMGSYGGSIDEA